MEEIVKEETKKEETIRRYKEMVEWAKTQDPLEHPSRFHMNKQIGTSWGGSNCAYCKDQQTLTSMVNCGECELIGVLGCCNRLWLRMDHTLEWSDWISCAEKLIEYVEKHG